MILNYDPAACRGLSFNPRRDGKGFQGNGKLLDPDSPAAAVQIGAHPGTTNQHAIDEQKFVGQQIDESCHTHIHTHHC